MSFLAPLWGDVVSSHGTHVLNWCYPPGRRNYVPRTRFYGGRYTAWQRVTLQWTLLNSEMYYQQLLNSWCPCQHRVQPVLGIYILDGMIIQVLINTTIIVPFIPARTALENWTAVQTHRESLSVHIHVATSDQWRHRTKNIRWSLCSYIRAADGISHHMCTDNSLCVECSLVTIITISMCVCILPGSYNNLS